MRVLRVILIMLVMLAFSASASALSMPFNFGSLTGFPTSTTALEPFSMFSSGITTLSPSDVTNKLQTTPSNSVNGLSAIPSIDSNWQWPSSNYNKWLNPITSYGYTINPSDPNSTPVPYTGPSAESTAYFNAPALTQSQLNEAVQIASTSPLCKEYNAYPSDNDVSWQYPYDGHTVDVLYFVGSPDSSVYGQIGIQVDLNTGTIVNSSFGDRHGIV